MIGDLLVVLYVLMCDDFEILIFEFDMVVDVVLVVGVLGVWMIGGGFGGVVIVVVE